MDRLPYARRWRRILSQTDGGTRAAKLIAGAQERYTQHVRQIPSNPPPADRRLLTRRVLPGLSIYQALLDELQDQGKALEPVEPLFRAAFTPPLLLAGIRALNYLPNPFVVVRLALKFSLLNAAPPGDLEIVTDTRDSLAFNQYCCPILEALEARQVPELAPLYCRTDEWLAAALPKVHFQRPHTLAQGDGVCDFRWWREERRSSIKRQKE